LLLPTAAYMLAGPGPALGLAAGIITHLAADILVNKPPPESMSLVLRAWKRKKGLRNHHPPG